MERQTLLLFTNTLNKKTVVFVPESLLRLLQYSCVSFGAQLYVRILFWALDKLENTSGMKSHGEKNTSLTTLSKKL
jgi:hypothetical protein